MERLGRALLALHFGAKPGDAGEHGEPLAKVSRNEDPILIDSSDEEAGDFAPVYVIDSSDEEEVAGEAGMSSGDAQGMAPDYYADFLEENGYVVIPCLDAQAREFSREKFKRIYSDSVELKPGAKKAVLGGFQAMAHASSFHLPIVRRIRRWAMHTCVTKLWRRYIQKYSPGDNLEQIIGRIMIRGVGEMPSSESWHRDISIYGDRENDKTFGGWINLNEFDQHFSCVPRTHKGPKGKGEGFNIFKKQEDIDRFKAMKTLVRIPPGHIMVFFEHLVHEVAGKRVKEGGTLYREFLAWRLTKQTTPLTENTVDHEKYQNLRKALTDFEVMMIKSGQTPPMYAKLHWTNWKQKLEDFAAESIDETLIETKRPKQTKKPEDMRDYRVPPREMPSGRELNKKGFNFNVPDYTEDEIRMHIPSRGPWKVLVPGTLNEDVVFI